MNLEQNRNEDWMKLALSKSMQHLEQIKSGGGKKSMAKQKERNKLNARERIAYLCDADQPFIELGAFAGFDMYLEDGGCPAGGTVAGLGYVSGRQCMIVANDQTVKAGAWFPITGWSCGEGSRSARTWLVAIRRRPCRHRRIHGRRSAAR